MLLDRRNSWQLNICSFPRIIGQPLSTLLFNSPTCWSNVWLWFWNSKYYVTHHKVDITKILFPSSNIERNIPRHAHFQIYLNVIKRKTTAKLLIISANTTNHWSSILVVMIANILNNIHARLRIDPSLRDGYSTTRSSKTN